VPILGLLIVVSLALGAIAWAFFVWTVRSGQYEDPEGAKYRMLEDEETASSEGPTSTATRSEAPTTTGTASSAATQGPAEAPSATVNTASFPQPPASPSSALASTAATNTEATRSGLPHVPASRRNGIHKP